MRKKERVCQLQPNFCSTDLNCYLWRFLPHFLSCLKQISGIFATALNRGLIQFELKAGVHIIVYMTQQTLGKLISC